MEKYIDMFSEGILQGLAPDEAEAFLNRCELISYRDGSVLFREMTEATRLYLPVSGAIELRFDLPGDKGEAVLATRKPGEAVGWSSMVPPHQYTFSGVCKGKTEVYEIDRATMMALFSTNYHLGFIFMRNIAVLSGDRLHRVQEELARVLCDEAVNNW